MGANRPGYFIFFVLFCILQTHLNIKFPSASNERSIKQDMLFHQTQQMYLGIQCVRCLWMGHIWIEIRSSKLANKQITNLHLTTRSLLLRPCPLLQCWSTYSLVIKLFFKPSSSNSCWLVIQHCFFPWQRLLVWFVLNIWKCDYDRICIRLIMIMKNIKLYYSYMVKN